MFTITIHTHVYDPHNPPPTESPEGKERPLVFKYKRRTHRVRRTRRGRVVELGRVEREPKGRLNARSVESKKISVGEQG